MLLVISIRLVNLSLQLSILLSRWVRAYRTAGPKERRTLPRQQDPSKHTIYS